MGRLVHGIDMNVNQTIETRLKNIKDTSKKRQK